MTPTSPAGPLRPALHPHQPCPEPRKRRRRAGPLPPQGPHRQALILRGSRDFHTTDDYVIFVSRMVQRRNLLAQGKLEQKLACLRPLPPAPNAGIRQLPGAGAQVEHHPGSRPHLHGALPPHREGGADPAVRGLGGSVLQGTLGGTDGAGARRAGGQRQLPPRHRLPGAQARGLRPLPFPGADLPHQAIPPVL